MESTPRIGGLNASGLPSFVPVETNKISQLAGPHCKQSSETTTPWAGRPEPSDGIRPLATGASSDSHGAGQETPKPVLLDPCAWRVSAVVQQLPSAGSKQHISLLWRVSNSRMLQSCDSSHLPAAILDWAYRHAMCWVKLQA